MNLTPGTYIGGAILLLVTLATIAFLPTEPAWKMLGQIAVSAAGMVKP